MAKRATGALLSQLELRADGGAPLHLQLYRHVRGAIVDGTLGAGARLPSTRTLAGELGVSRTTVEGA